MNIDEPIDSKPGRIAWPCVRGIETEEDLNRLEERGITLVKLQDSL